mgnify:CR=1 FL=1
MRAICFTLCWLWISGLAWATDWYPVEVLADGEPMWLKARTVVNAAGLFACPVARAIHGLNPHHVPTERYAAAQRISATGYVRDATRARRLSPGRGVDAWRSRIARLQLGDIVLHDIPASIVPGMDKSGAGTEILLGMSALKQLEFHQQGNQLTLIQH